MQGPHVAQPRRQADLRRQGAVREVRRLGVQARDEDGVGLVGVEREVVVAHAGDEGDAAEPELALQIGAGFDDIALREVLGGEDEARPHRLSGGRVRLGAVALHVEVVGLVAGPERDQHAVVRAPQPLLALRRPAVADLLVDDVAAAQRPERRPEAERRPRFVDDLRGVVELPVHLPRQQVEAAAGEGLVEREPLALLRVEGLGIVDEPGEPPEVDQPVVREPVRLDAGVVRLGGGAEPVARRRVEDQLGQHLPALRVLRVRRRPGVVLRVDGALVADLAAAVEAREHRRLEPLAAPGGGDVHAHVVGAAVPGRLAAEVEALLVAQVVGGVLGEQGHDAPQRVAAVEGRVRAAHDLDRLQDVHVEPCLVDVERAEVELLGGLDPVHQGHHAVPADAADVEAVEPEAGHVVLDVDARLVLHEVGEVLDHPFLDRLAVDDRHHARRVPHRGRAQGGGDGDRIEEGRRFVERRFGGGFRGVPRRSGGRRLRVRGGGFRVVRGRSRSRLRERNGGRQHQDQNRRCGGRDRGGSTAGAESVHGVHWMAPC